MGNSLIVAVVAAASSAASSASSSALIGLIAIVVSAIAAAAIAAVSASAITSASASASLAVASSSSVASAASASAASALRGSLAREPWRRKKKKVRKRRSKERGFLLDADAATLKVLAGLLLGLAGAVGGRKGDKAKALGASRVAVHDDLAVSHLAGRGKEFAQVAVLGLKRQIAHKDLESALIHNNTDTKSETQKLLPLRARVAHRKRGREEKKGTCPKTKKARSQPRAVAKD